MDIFQFLHVEYCDGQSAAVRRAVVCPEESNELILRSEDDGSAIVSWPVEDLIVSPSASQSLVIYRDKSETAYLLSHEKEKWAGFIQYLESKRPSLQRDMKLEKRPFLRTAFRFAIPVFLLFGALLLGLNYSASWVAKMIPISWESSIFPTTAFDVLKCEMTPAATNTLNVLTSDLIRSDDPIQANKFSYEVSVVNMPMANAFALPGGKIFFTRQLIQEAKSIDEIAGVLAHEMEHVRQRHVMAGQIRNSTATFLLSGLGDKSLGSMLASVALLRFDRKDEASADEGALARLRQAGYSANGIAEFFERAGKHPLTDRFSFLTTHPSTAERIALFRASALKSRRAKKGQVELSNLEQILCKKSSFSPFN